MTFPYLTDKRVYLAALFIVFTCVTFHAVRVMQSEQRSFQRDLRYLTSRSNAWLTSLERFTNTRIIQERRPGDVVDVAETDIDLDTLLGNSTSARDPRLVAHARRNIRGPSGKLMKMSNVLYKTKQTAAVIEILNNKRGGFFIECGALDGERSSNTLFLERQLAWTGLLVEMDPSWFMQLTGKNRNAYSINACISPYQYAYKMNFVEHTGGHGKLVKSNEKNVKSDNAHRVHEEVICYPLYTMLLALNQTHIDYFSLDVEGLELEILKSIPWSLVDITVLSVEYIHGKSEQEYIEFMKQQGYQVHSKVHAHDSVRAYYADDIMFVKS